MPRFTSLHQLYWRRRVLRLAAPIILANLSTPLVGAVDTAVVGHLPGPLYIGAVALGAIVFSFLYWGFGFLRLASGGFMARALGAHEPGEMLAVPVRGLTLALMLGLAMIALQRPIIELAMAGLAPGAELEAITRDYYRVRIWSAPAALAQYVALGCLLGMQRIRAVLLLQLQLNLGNVALDLLFVPVLDWGVPGVAAATVISEYGAALLGAWLVYRALASVNGGGASVNGGGASAHGGGASAHGGGASAHGMRPDWRRVFAPARLAEMLRANGNIMLRTVALSTAFAWFAARGASLGPHYLAANAVLLHFQTFMAFALDGFADATETLAGSSAGKRSLKDFDATVRASTRAAALVAGGMALLFLALGTVFIGWMTTDPEVRTLAAVYLPWVVVSPLLSVWSFQLDGIFVGVTRGAEMRNAMLVSLVLYLGACQVLIPALGNHGLWLSLMVFMVARAVTLGWYYPKIRMGFVGGNASGSD